MFKKKKKSKVKFLRLTSLRTYPAFFVLIPIPTVALELPLRPGAHGETP